jgi:hypothetical protein
LNSQGRWESPKDENTSTLDLFIYATLIKNIRRNLKKVSEQGLL